MVPWGEAFPWHEDLEDAPADLFVFCAVGDEVQHRGKQQVDVGQEDMNERGSMSYDKTMSNGSSTTVRMTTANPYMLLNVLSAHTSLIRS